MKLKEFRVREFMSIWDSGPVGVDDQVTCLVGKNEAGKTALLTALYRTNPIIPEDAVFDETYDYPKREVEDYRSRSRMRTARRPLSSSACTNWMTTMSKPSRRSSALRFSKEDVHAQDILRKSNSKFTLYCRRARRARTFGRRSRAAGELKDALKEAADWDAFAAALTRRKPRKQSRRSKELVAKVRENGLAHYIFNSLIWPRAPKFLYFDEYYQMKGQANLNALDRSRGRQAA